MKVCSTAAENIDTMISN